jgi:hypothetical protein
MNSADAFAAKLSALIGRKPLVLDPRTAVTESFRSQTGKRKGEAFQEGGSWWVIDASGHQWCLVDKAWECFTDEDDGYARWCRKAA